MYGTAAYGRENAASPISPSFGKLAKNAQTVPKEGQLYSHFLCHRPNGSVHMGSPPPYGCLPAVIQILIQSTN